MTALPYVGAAYAAIFLCIFVYAWRLTGVSRQLAAKIEELESDAAGKPGA